MKNHFLKLAVLGALTCSGFAGTPVITTSKEFKAPAPVLCFQDQEFSIDLFGSYNDGRPRSNTTYQDGFGGGVGMNFFFARYFGVGIEGNWWGGGEDNTVIHAVSGNFFLRYPIDEICLAPYIMGGGGGNFDGDKVGTGHIGGGIEYRATPNVGIFADGRYVFTGHNANDVANYRLGLRIVF